LRSPASWAVPLAAAALAVAVRHQPATSGQASPDGVPPYYVALTVPGTYTDSYPGGDGTAAEVRATATGAVLARITVPRPYVQFAAVTAAADDRTFVLVAQEKSHPPASLAPYYQPSRFYLLHFDPASGRASLRALPAAFIPANNEVCDTALSPDGTLLAADIGSACVQGARLHVFDLATGNVRVWNAGTSAFGFGGTNPDALSWTADGKHVAFVGSSVRPARSGVRLLDVTAPGSDLLADSKPTACEWPALGSGTFFPVWRGLKVTPDGRTVVILEELASGTAPARARDRLLKCSTATGQVTTVLNDRNTLGGYWYEQVMYTNATGSVLVVTGVRKGNTAGILRGDAYTPIPWSAHTVTAVW
jgi:Tol biopolymer transport system component